jgi:hypothetical protein
MVTLPNGDGQGNNGLLLVSFHATSGFGATQNCEGYFDEFYQNDFDRSIPLLWIVGGDFNCNPRKGVHMPTASTHQSDHVLDGFFADQQATNFEVTLISGPQTYVVGNNPGQGRLITDTSVNPHGYVVNGLHLSDHCPVTAQFQIERDEESEESDDSEDSEDVDIPRTRKRKVPIGFGTSPTKRTKT